MEQESKTIDEWIGTVKVGKQGNSVVLMITDAAHMMKLEKGDIVQVIIRKK